MVVMRIKDFLKGYQINLDLRVEEKDIEAISHRLSAWILIPTFATATRPEPTQAHA